MKITKTQLKQMIKEEFGRVLNESSFEDLETEIRMSVSSIEKGKMPMTPEEMQNMMVKFIDDALFLVRNRLGGVLELGDFDKAVVRAAKEWVEE